MILILPSYALFKWLRKPSMFFIEMFLAVITSQRSCHLSKSSPSNWLVRSLASILDTCSKVIHNRRLKDVFLWWKHIFIDISKQKINVLSWYIKRSKTVIALMFHLVHVVKTHNNWCIKTKCKNCVMIYKNADK